MEAGRKPGIRRIGIMGGTFDPIHNGHLALADAAYRQLTLDEVLFLPAGNPPHKRTRPEGATDSQRLAMVQYAISDYPQFVLDQEEMRRGGLSYTKDTLLRMKDEKPDTEFFFIIGADSLMAMDTWYHPEIICRCCHLAAAIRDEYPLEVLQGKASELEQRYHASIFMLNTPRIPISSTELRRLCREGRSIRSYVPAAVADFIEKNDIYGSQAYNERL